MEASETITAVRDSIRKVTDGIELPIRRDRGHDALIQKLDHQAHEGRRP
jgi:outer membrane lipoprotein SlyB